MELKKQKNKNQETDGSEMDKRPKTKMVLGHQNASK